MEYFEERLNKLIEDRLIDATLLKKKKTADAKALKDKKKIIDIIDDTEHTEHTDIEAKNIEAKNIEAIEIVKKETQQTKRLQSKLKEVLK